MDEVVAPKCEGCGLSLTDWNGNIMVPSVDSDVKWSPRAVLRIRDLVGFVKPVFAGGEDPDEVDEDDEDDDYPVGKIG